MKIMKSKLSIYRRKKNHDTINFDWLMKTKWVMIPFWLANKKEMIQDAFWLVDRKTLNEKKNLKVPRVLLLIDVCFYII